LEAEKIMPALAKVTARIFDLYQKIFVSRPAKDALNQTDPTTIQSKSNKN